jgi:histone H3/H4
MAKGASKSVKHAAKKGAGKKGGRKGKRTFSVYVRRSLKAINAKLTVSSKAAAIVNSFIADQFDRIATEAAAIARSNRRQTLGSREVQTAVRLLLPAELAKHAISEATRAVAKLASA